MSGASPSIPDAGLPPRNCAVCRSASVATLIDFGPQALSNRFLAAVDQPEPHFSFGLGQCQSCGMPQFLEPIDVEELKPRFDWITYAEPEGHLDELVRRVQRLPGIARASAIAGASFKDDSTLARFRQLGFDRVWRLDPGEDLGVRDRCAGLETIAARLSVEATARVAAARGQADVLFLRHILEHSPAPGRFLQAVGTLVRPGGYLVVEVPDCAPALRRRDYTLTWEEHILYFTPELLRRCLALWGWRAIHEECHAYGHENALVAVAQANSADTLDDAAVAAAIRAGQAYASAWPQTRRRVADSLAHCAGGQRTIALFGAGHCSSAWVNYFDVGRRVAFVVDDHPGKRGLFMPGSRLPIRGSSELLSRGIRLCLTGLGAESEAKVAARNGTYLARGGVFRSIFPGRPNSFTG